MTNIPKVDGSNSSIPIRRHVDRSSKSSTNKVSVGSHNSIDMVEEFGQAFVDDVDRFCANVMIDKGETFGKALRYNDATQREATTNILKETSMLRLLVRRLQEMRAVDETKRDVLEVRRNVL